MKKILSIIAAVGLISTAVNAQTQLNQYQPGFRLTDGSQLNLMVNQVNALTGIAGAPGTLYGSTLTVNASTGPVAKTSLFAATAGTTIRTVGPNTTNNRILVDAIAGIPIVTVRRTDGTIAAPTSILSADEIGTFNYHGLNTTATYTGGARLAALATENWSATAAGTKLVFSTVPNTTLTMTDQVTIDNDGTVTAKAATFSGLLRTTYGTPTIASGACGTTTNGVITSGTNQAGLITIGAASTTTCTVSFSATLAAAPNACVAFPASAGAAATGTTVARVSSVTTTQFVITGSALATTAYYYICI